VQIAVAAELQQRQEQREVVVAESLKNR